MFSFVGVSKLIRLNIKTVNSESQSGTSCKILIRSVVPMVVDSKNFSSSRQVWLGVQ